MQERSPGNAIGSLTLKARGVVLTAIATDDVVAGPARIIRIVKPELSVVENVECFGAKLQF